MYRDCKLTLGNRAETFIFDIADCAVDFINDETGMCIELDHGTYEIDEYGITVMGIGCTLTGYEDMFNVKVEISRGTEIIKLIVWNGDYYQNTGKRKNRYEFKWIRHRLRRELWKEFDECAEYYHTEYRATYDENGKIVKLRY